MEIDSLRSQLSEIKQELLSDRPPAGLEEKSKMPGEGKDRNRL